MSAQWAEAKVLVQVIEKGRSLSATLADTLVHLAASDRGVVQEVCYGVMRWQPRLEAVLAQLLPKSLRKRDRDLHALLLASLYRLIYTRTPRYATVNSAVEAARLLGKGWATGLVNALLRNFLRGEGVLLERADDTPVGHYAHPDWLIHRLRVDWPQAWQSLLNAANARPPMSLRVNALRANRDEYLRRLAAAGLAAVANPTVSSAITLSKPQPVKRLPGFDRGEVSVQDVAAQLTAPLLGARTGERVLDACAAPGGKTGHILELQPELASLVAVDIDAQRLEQVRQNLDRLDLSATLINGDVGDPNNWWDGQPFDRILLDVPCSGTGVIRRHPDIKLLRRESDISVLVRRQQRLLRSLWPLLVPGGMLLYVTCSILKAENEYQIRTFLEAEPHASEQPIHAPWGVAGLRGRQILTGQGGMDGFYYACVRKGL